MPKTSCYHCLHSVMLYRTKTKLISLQRKAQIQLHVFMHMTTFGFVNPQGRPVAAARGEPGLSVSRPAAGQPCGAASASPCLHPPAGQREGLRDSAGRRGSAVQDGCSRGPRAGLRSRRRLPAGRRSPPCPHGPGGRAGGGDTPAFIAAPHRGALPLGAAEEPCRGAAARSSPPYPAPAGSAPRSVSRGCGPAPPLPRSIPCSRLFSPPRRPTWFSPGQALGISPVPFEEPRFRLASSLPPPLRTARSRLGPPAGAAPAAPAPAPQVPAARGPGTRTRLARPAGAAGGSGGSSAGRGGRRAVLREPPMPL